MTNYKCPICGNPESVEVKIVSTDLCYYPSVHTGKGHYYLPARGLINYSFSHAGADLYIKDNCTTSVCTQCGFVSMHALAIAQEIIQEQTAIKKQKEELQVSLDSLDNEIEELRKESRSLSQKKADLLNQLEDENITVKHQKELKLELDETRKRIEIMLSLIEKKENEKRAFEPKMKYYQDCLKYSSGNKVSELIDLDKIALK